jgi:quercetin dioxygenase-like cupin family protein
MKRNKFIASILIASASTFSAKSSGKKALSRTDKGFKVKAGEGRIHGHIKLKGVNSNILDVKISGKDTDGGFAVFEQTSISQGRGTPLHVHHFQDEIFYVIEGEYYFQIGEDKFKMYAGETIFLPQKVPHAWTQVSEKGKMNVTFQPAGKMEEFFVTVSGLDHEPTPKEMAQIFNDNEMEVVGLPLKID